MFKIRSAEAADVAGMLMIYAPIVRDTAISFEFEVPTVEAFSERLRQTRQHFPWLVAVDAEETVLGYAYAGPHRQRAAYQWSCEVSAYVDAAHRAKGVGRRLYQELFRRLEQQGFRNAFAGITMPNETSIAFHRALGFRLIGTYPEVGWKCGAWRDVSWWGRTLGDKSSPPAPPLPPGGNDPGRSKA